MGEQTNEPRPAPAATGSKAPPGTQCSFCPWPAVNELRAARPTAAQKLLKRPLRKCYICSRHLIRGLQYVRKGY